MTQQNAALVEESAAAAESLKDQAAGLSDLVSTFRLGERRAAAGPGEQRLRRAQYARSFTRSRAIDWLCSWQTRDSVTFSTAAISFRFMSCS